jgi:predicted Zn-dependent peptidase
LYDVGARDEDPERTGFAHLFEHLMFGGSVNIPSYDEPLDAAGGDNNAFTNNDMTNYYLTIPTHNVEIGFWLESDRMLNLAFTPKSLEVQRQVVIEEFKQRYLNQPYGEAWLELRPLAYKVHPYQWATIGKEIKHIKEAVMEDVKDFFKRFYNPNNAILCVAGNLSLDEVKRLCDKYFAPIPSGPVPSPGEARKLPKEPRQTEGRRKEISRQVPQQAIYMAFHMTGRRSPDYYATDLASDVLSRGESSRIHQKLVKEKKLFTEMDAYVSGDFDEGLFVFQGKFNDDVTPEQAEAAIWEEIEHFKNSDISVEELQKVKNQIEASVRFGEMSVLGKAMSLCMAELLEDADLVNTEFERYDRVSAEDILKMARQVLVKSNCSTLIYKKS